jgi:7,8-dihydroneopterin aldolase/epimerase/oxygenase
MSWKVFLRALRVEAEVGCYPEELGRLQPLVVDVELDLSDGPIERLRDTVNYADVAEAARRIAASGHIDLIETYAERVAKACLEHPRAARVRVRVEKLEAIRDAVAGVELTLESARPGS